MRLFWEKGFSAVSLPELEARTGLSRSSLYNSFGSKHEMFEQSLELYRAAIGGQMYRALESGTGGLADLLAFFAAAAGRLTRDRAMAGCLLVNSMVEFGGEDGSVARNSSGHLQRLRQAFIKALERAVALAEIPPGHLAEKANLLLGLLLGLSVAARAGLPQAEIGSLVNAASTQISGWSEIT